MKGYLYPSDLEVVSDERRLEATHIKNLCSVFTHEYT